MRNLKTLNNSLPKREPRQMTRMDKLKAHYLEGRKLPKSLEETLANLERANALLCSGYSKEQAVKFMIERDSFSKSHAYKVLRDSMELFGDVTKASKEGLRHIATENLMQIYNQARSAKNLEMAERVWDTICKLNGLYGRDESTTNNNLQMNMQFVFTTDPSVLTQELAVELPEFQVQ